MQVFAAPRDELVETGLLNADAGTYGRGQPGLRPPPVQTRTRHPARSIEIHENLV